VTDTQGRLLAMLSDRDVWLRLADWQAFQQHQSVSEIMQSRVVCATEDTDIRVLAGAMAQNHIGSVPIIDAQGDLCGIVTRTDILLLVTTHPRFELWT
jgi:CBS domain-containing protein